MQIMPFYISVKGGKAAVKNLKFYLRSSMSFINISTILVEVWGRVSRLIVKVPQMLLFLFSEASPKVDHSTLFTETI